MLIDFTNATLAQQEENRLLIGTMYRYYQAFNISRGYHTSDSRLMEFGGKLIGHFIMDVDNKLAPADLLPEEADWDHPFIRYVLQAIADGQPVPPPCPIQAEQDRLNKRLYTIAYCFQEAIRNPVNFSDPTVALGLNGRLIAHYIAEEATPFFMFDPPNSNYVVPRPRPDGLRPSQQLGAFEDYADATQPEEDKRPVTPPTQAASSSTASAGSLPVFPPSQDQQGRRQGAANSPMLYWTTINAALSRPHNITTPPSFTLTERQSRGARAVHARAPLPPPSNIAAYVDDITNSYACIMDEPVTIPWQAVENAINEARPRTNE
jgi:hypothetical protein